MAKVQKRTWLSRGASGRKVRKVSWGYTLQVNGKQERKFAADWTEEDARTELAKRILAKDTTKARPTTLAQAVDRYLQAKARKRSIAEDRRMLKHLVTRFGAQTQLSALTSEVISQYRDERLSQPSTRRGNDTGLLSPCTVQRELSLLSHLLRLAHDEWNALAVLPRIRRLEEPQGRLRWLRPDEEGRILAECRRSRNPELYAIAVLALETGMRQGEILGLTWDRIDFSRGVIQLEITKSDRRREIPMRQIVNDVLAALPGSREGKVWRQGARHAFEAAVVRAKIENFRFHDCRHHFASWFIMRGGSLAALKDLLGHHNFQMTLRYAHLAPGHLRAEMLKTESAAHSQHTALPELVPADSPLAPEAVSH
jgi:integrase